MKGSQVIIMNKKTPVFNEFKHMLHGGDYNPDQWLDTPGIIDEDMRLMKLANCNTMTLGIFCWQVIEPADGVYDLTYIDSMIKKIGDNGGKVILSTPSGSKPAWMSEKYPEIIRTNSMGLKEFHGNRHNHCFTSPVYRRKVREINELLSEHFGNNDTVIGWHLSNEYGGECHCELCQEAFREWLKVKYKTLDALNHAYWAKFWSHTYTSWSQIHSPSPIGESGMHGLILDWKRFVSDQTIDFMKAEKQAIRKYSDKPVTANFMRVYDGGSDANDSVGFTGIDYRKMAKELDFISWDAYPKWHRDDASDEYAYIDFNHDMFRSLKDKPFILMECTPSLTNWHDYNKLKRPGVNRLSGLQAVAHGSDSVLYFQFRKSRGSSEKFHGAVVDHCGHENTRVFREISALGETLKNLDDVIGTSTESEVAFVTEWENLVMLPMVEGFQKGRTKYTETLIKHYRSFRDKGINVDVRGYDDDLSKYRIVICPMMYMVNDDFIKKVAEYVRNGGIFVTTYMAGMVDENDLCYLGGFPGGELGKVFGIWNEEIDSLYPNDSNTVSAFGKTYKAVDYCELIHAEGAETLGEYSSDFYSGMSAVTVNNYGKGRAYYIAFRDDGEFTRDFYEKLISEVGIKSSICGTLGDGVTCCSRTDGENDYVFVMNFLGSASSVTLDREYINVETGETLLGNIEIAPYGSMILKTKK